MNKQFLKDAFGWGFILWLIGYVLGMILFFLVPPTIIGWIILPIGTVITLWILFKKVHPVKYAEGVPTESVFNRVKGDTRKYYFNLAIIWMLIAIVFDYLFIVKALKPADGYYKPDIYLYYALTFILPIIVGWRKNKLMIK